MGQDPQTTSLCPVQTPLTPADRRRGVFFLGLAVGAVGFTFAVQMGVNSNFMADEMGLTGYQQGLLETFRERTAPLIEHYRSRQARILHVEIGVATQADDVWELLHGQSRSPSGRG